MICILLGVKRNSLKSVGKRQSRYCADDVIPYCVFTSLFISFPVRSNRFFFFFKKQEKKDSSPSIKLTPSAIRGSEEKQQ